MKAIAFAIICAAYITLPRYEVERWDNASLAINALVFLVCIFGFWLSIIFERK